MVATLKFLFSFLLIAASFYSCELTATDISLSAELDQNVVEPNHPIQGTVTVVHPKTTTVDTGAFSVGGIPLNVELVKKIDYNPASDTTASIYRFELTGMAEGIQTLPSIAVLIDGKSYYTIPTTFVVRSGGSATFSTTGTSIPQTRTTSTAKASASRPTSSAAVPAGTTNTVLKLEAGIDGKGTLYPGQRTTVFYRYYYNANIDLLEEYIPLLDAVGFRKIGQKIVQDAANQSLAVRQVSQVIQAINPGQFSFGPSVVEGYVYTLDSAGQKKYAQPKLRAEAPNVDISVLAFPETGKPSSFNGAVGQFTISTQLLSPAEMNVGDLLTLSIVIQGTGDLNDAPMPDICCQPGFSGVFQQSDIPPMEDFRGAAKVFVAQMRPLNDSITEIPKLTLAFFDPATGKYGEAHSRPIPITVHPNPSNPNTSIEQWIPLLDREEERAAKEGSGWPLPSSAPVVTPLAKNKETPEPDSYSSWWFLLILPIGIIVIEVIKRWRRQQLEETEGVPVAKESDKLLAEANRERYHSSLFYHLLGKALIARLHEANLIDSPDTAPVDLPQEGVAGKVRLFLVKIDEQRFTGKGTPSADALLEQAARFFQEIPH